MKKNSVNIMDHVSIMDLVRAHVMQPKPGYFQVMFESIDRTKNVVIDEGALKEFNVQVTERMSESDARDPQTKTKIEEFCMKLLEGLYKNGLAELVEAKNPKSDPYADMRQSWDKPNLN